MKNPEGVQGQGQHGQIPGLLGMNVINQCYQELFIQHGDPLFQAPGVQALEKEWKKALAECRQLDRVLETGLIGRVRVRPGPAVLVPAVTLKFVPAICHTGLGSTFSSGLLEPLPLENCHLPCDLIISSAFLPVTQGRLEVPVVNVGTHDRWIRPKVVLGEFHLVSLQPTTQVQFNAQRSTGEQVAIVQAVAVEELPSVDFSQVVRPNLSSQEELEARNLLERYSDIFSYGEGDLGFTTLVDTIPLLDETPVRQGYRRLPPSQYDQVKMHIQELVDQGVVKQSCSPYASPIVVVQKKNGSIRLCVDYRQLNLRTRKDAFPLQQIKESLDALAGARLFSTLDLASGYNQVPVASRDQEKTAFCTPFGLFEFTRMPFGLCNAPSTFQHLMERIFGDQQFHALLLYLDDIVVFSTASGEVRNGTGTSPAIPLEIEATKVSSVSD